MDENDYRLIAKYSTDKFNMLSEKIKLSKSKVKKITDNEKQRFGFYFLVMDLLFEENNIEDVDKLIIDTRYNFVIHKKNITDYGVDLVYINDKNKKIYLIQFKYRESLTKNYQIIENDITPFYKWFQYHEKKENENDNRYHDFKAIINTLTDGTNGCWYNIEVLYVSNEDIRNKDNLADITNEMEDKYNVKFSYYGINELIQKIEERKHKKTDAKLVINTKNLISNENLKKDQKLNYLICRLTLLDLIKITCNDESIRLNESKNYEMGNIDIEKDVLYENVRGYLGKTNYNKEIIKTLENENNNFFYFNNGVTITATNLQIENLSSGNTNKIKLKIANLQIVNGAQTLMSLYHFINDKKQNIEKLKNTYILVRFFCVDEYKRSCQNILGNKIAQYTNSQNKVNSSDLKSLDEKQFQIENYLASKNIIYIRKRDKGNSKTSNSITKDKFGQILWAIKGYPQSVSNKKEKIFTSEYNSIFDFDIKNSPNYIESFNKIKETASKLTTSKSDKTEQHYFYILYVLYNYADYFTIDDVEKIYNLLISSINEYKKDGKIVKRPMITDDFKKQFDADISDYIKKESNGTKDI